MRYTFKNSGVLNLGEPVNIIGYEEYSKRYHDAVPKALVKLGQLEDIEDVLGIDLLMLFEALSHGFWNGHYHVDPSEIAFDYSCRSIVENPEDPEYREYFLGEYGKTWALTKEELL